MRVRPRPDCYTVETFPYDPVRMACRRCQRRGQYAKATLRARYGADAVMPAVRVALADCRHHQDWSQPCLAYFHDLALSADAGSYQAGKCPGATEPPK